ncbi:radical SAM protein [Pseudothermotoga thermarum]|uniref:Radical SAM domain protein n=1 Tax=Pseudothermotoga thermarum DSM 5069 TaxID=688269 RepID=F7YYH3_9THEM|nr:radical SAM protein [Pseudothermotoga thermarum]AEH50999.1 Radical SAM domain protein [Pseudothermotoga thermarum DSM 5069]
MKAVIVDGYIDEPAALGVPPYISHYVRYAAGVLINLGFFVDYFTIDQIRRDDLWKMLSQYDVVFVIGGVTVPGRYVGGTPITLKEIEKIFEICERSEKLIAGPLAKFYVSKGGSKASTIQLKDCKTIGSDLVGDLVRLFTNLSPSLNNWNLVKDAALAGTEIIKKHPFYPRIICEIELSRGCERLGHCSFCIEPVFYPTFTSRPVEHVVEEIVSLYKAGCKAFRLGRAANVLAYYADRNSGKPCPQVFEELYSAIRNNCPEIEILHHDNANPSYIVRYENECAKILETIVKYNSPGDVLSFGVESFDEKVLKMNNIGNSPEIVLRAVEIVNEIGSVRVEGVPKLLPGINLLYGLIGETKETYEKNYQWLKRILEKGLLLRRINIRQVMVEPGTPLWNYYQKKKIKVDRKFFNFYKEKIRAEIDLPMFRKVFPVGTVLRKVYPEFKEGKVTFGRQLGTYPILVGIPFENVEGPIDVIIVDHGPRSVTAIRHPFDLNKVSYEELLAIPKIGKARAARILLSRPFKKFEEVEKILDDKEVVELLKNLKAVIS